MRGDITFKILEVIAGMGTGLANAAEAALSAGYGASQGRLMRELRRVESERDKRKKTREIEARLRHRYRSMISHLKAEGLIVVSPKASSYAGGLKLTERGRLLLSKMRGTKKERFFPEKNYSAEKSGVFTIVAFDVPEKYRTRRDWLRDCLRNMGLKMIQKSVWLGKVKIPKEFIDDLKKMDLLEAVEIFEISKGGTLIDRT